MAKVKSMIAVNTSPLAQAFVGGLLLESGCTLGAASAAKVQPYKRNRNCLLQSLREALSTVDGVTWNEPRGGFFLALDMPLSTDDTSLLESPAMTASFGYPCAISSLARAASSK